MPRDSPDHPREVALFMDEHGNEVRYIRTNIAQRWRRVLERMSEGGPYEDVWIPDDLHEEIQRALSDE